MLNLPNQAFIDKFLPKKSFEEKVVNGKKVFKDISKITLKYKLAPNTINIEASENIKEILIFELILNEKNIPKDAIKKIQRWQKIAEVAAKQSKRDTISKIENVIKFKDIIKIIEDYDIFIVAYEEEKNKKLKQVLTNIKNKQLKEKENENINIGILIGPEGGIDKKEIEELQKTNSQIITLGNRILRTETAPIAITSIIMYELER